jgi:hypothetical protein
MVVCSTVLRTEHDPELARNGPDGRTYTCSLGVQDRAGVCLGSGRMDNGDNCEPVRPPLSVAVCRVGVKPGATDTRYRDAVSPGLEVSTGAHDARIIQPSDMTHVQASSPTVIRVGEVVGVTVHPANGTLRARPNDVLLGKRWRQRLMEQEQLFGIALRPAKRMPVPIGERRA